MAVQNFVFSYSWDKKPVLNELLIALIKKDFEEAEKYAYQLDEFECTTPGSGRRGYNENPKFATFKRCLYEFLIDYDIIKFLVNNGFRKGKFTQICCSNGSREMGIVGRAYYGSKDRRIVTLLLDVGFTVFDHGGLIGNNHIPMWKAVMIYDFDREIIDLMLVHGQTVTGLLDEIKFCDDAPGYKPWAADYLKSKLTLTENRNRPYSYSEEYTYNQQGNRKSSQEGCYIATAVYGGYDEPQVLILRKYRDEVLKQTFFGRLFIKVYYAVSPRLVQILKPYTWINEKIRCVLDCFVNYISKK